MSGHWSALRHRWRDHALSAFASLSALAVVGVFVWIVVYLLREGVGHIGIEFLLEEPRDAGRQGGISTVLVATALLLLVSVLTALPIGIGTAVLLSKQTSRNNRLSRWLRGSLDVLAAVPSIVFGLFGYVFFSQWLGLGVSILSGGLTLACMVLPVIVSTAEKGISSVHEDLQSSAVALGLTEWTSLVKVSLPAAMPAICAGVLLAIGRSVAETAALLFTSGYVSRMPESLLDSGRSISIHVLDLSMNVPGGEAAACATALILLVFILLFNAPILLFERWFLRRHNA